MFDIIVIGSNTLDVFVDTADNLFKPDQKKFPFGSKILVKDITFGTGGGGTNVAVAVSKLGLKTSYLGKMGHDHSSDLILKDLKKFKIDTSLVSRVNDTTGFSVILDSKGHDRTILAYKGVNDNLSYNELRLSKLKTKWFYFGTMLDQSYKTLKKLADFARRNHIKIMFNPSNYLAKKGISYNKAILKATSILVLNMEEAIQMTKKNNLEKIFSVYRKLGIEIVCITDGKKGVHTYDGHCYYYLKPHNVKIVEATGAGDSFASGFLAGIIKNKTVEQSLRIGQEVAENVILHKGIKNNLLDWKTALNKAEKHRKIEKIVIKC